MAEATEDPQVVIRFTVEFSPHLDGLEVKEVSGLGYEVEVVRNDIVTGTQESSVAQMLPGRWNWQDIVIKYQADANSLQVWEWRKQVEEMDMEGSRVNGLIKAFNRAGDVIAQWDVENAWPIEVSGPDMDTTFSQMATEQVILAHEGIERTV